MFLKHLVKFRELLWPIQRHELRKILPLFAMFFCISLNYNIFHCVKDSILISNSDFPGAEILPYVKFWGVMPASVIFIMLYSKLSNLISRDKVFYFFILLFIFFFSIFSLFLYPNSELIHPKTLSLPFFPPGVSEVIRLWSFTLFYIFSEMWGAIAMSLLFWQFTNQITTVGEAKRFYNFLFLGANVALVSSGCAIKLCCKLASRDAGISNVIMASSLNMLTLLFALSGILTIIIYHWFNRLILKDLRLCVSEASLRNLKTKLNLSFGQSIKMFLSSSYLICLALLVICYGICINFLEVTWKSFLKIEYPDANTYLSFMGDVNTCTGIATIIMTVFFSGGVLRKFGWSAAALITPVVMLFSGLIFFNVVVFQDKFEPILSIFGNGAVTLAVWLGVAQNIIVKACKFSLFDPTKEMLYIPLGEEAKAKGKAAIDVVSSRLGKATGSVIQQVLFKFGNLVSNIVYLEAIFFLIMILWVTSILRLGKAFAKFEGSRTYKPQ